MGKYLDIARKIEAKRQAEGQTKPTPTATGTDSHALYRQTAESVREDCFAIDPVWLVDHQPNLWQRLCWLDFKASEFERRGETGTDYKHTLERIVETVNEARQLFEAEQGKKAIAS